jgi:hypothetical protein
VPTLDRPQERPEGDDGLAGADVPLEEPLHGPVAGQVAIELGDRRLLLRGQHERERRPVADEELSRLAESRRGRRGVCVAPTAAEAEQEHEELLEREPLVPPLALVASTRPVSRTQRVGPRRKPLVREDANGQRIGREAAAIERTLCDLEELHRRDVLARRVQRHEPEGAEAAAVRDLVPFDAEARQPPPALQPAVEQEARPGSERVGEPGLVEPHRRRTAADAVGDDGLHDLQVAAASRPDRDALDGAFDGRLLADRELSEGHGFVPVEEGTRQVLAHVPDGVEAQAAETLGNLRADARKHLDGELQIGDAAGPRHGLRAGEAGRRRA